MSKEVKITEKEAIKKVIEYKHMAEYNIICILYKEPQLIHSYETLSIETFSDNKCKVYFAILEGVVKTERKAFDEIQVQMFLEKHKINYAMSIIESNLNTIKERLKQREQAEQKIESIEVTEESTIKYVNKNKKKRKNKLLEGIE